MPSNHWNDETFEVNDGGEGSSPKAKSGMGPAMKVFVVLLCVGGVLGLICCGGIAWWGAGIAKSTTDVPAEVEARARQFVEMEIPETLLPEIAMQISLLGTQTDFVIYQSEDDQSALILMNFSMDVPNAEQQFEQQMRQQQQGKEMRIEESETREFEIRGAKVPFQFAKGTVNNQKFRQVSGAFRGPKGTTFLLLQVPEAAYDEEAVVQMLESIE